MNAATLKEKKWDFMTTLIGVVIGSLIAVVPTWITLRTSNKDKTEERKLAIIHRRIDLIDKTSQVFYKLPGIEELMNYGIVNNVSLSPSQSSVNISRIPKDISVSKEMSLARAEFFSLIIQDQLYFGPKTRLAIEKMFKGKGDKQMIWWLIPEESYSKVINEMVAELGYE